jgi:GT2 family glycosyltransferase
MAEEARVGWRGEKKWKQKRRVRLPWWWQKRVDRWQEAVDPRRKLVREHWMKLGQTRQYAARPLWVGERTPVERMDWPEVAVVTPSFEQVRYVRSAVESVLGQDYPALRYAILDGGSRDGSAEVVREYEGRVDWVRSERDGGQAAALREGFERLGGEIMGWLNSDDVWLPGTLRRVGDFFRRHPEVDVVYGNRVVIDEVGQEVGRWIMPEHDRGADEALRRLGYVPQETMFWRRGIYEKVGGIDPGFRYAMDWDLYLRMRRAGARIVHLPEFLGCFRVHGEQKNEREGESVGALEGRRLLQRELGSDEGSWAVGRYYRGYLWAGYQAARRWEKSAEGKAWNGLSGVI